VPTLLAHITHNQISLDRVLRVEREVLAGVDFSVTVPTTQNFLDTCAVRCIGLGVAWEGLATAPPLEAVVGGPAEARPKFWHLADFFCQLTLLKHEYCSHLPSMLASAAVILSVWALDGPQPIKTALLEDIGHVWNMKRKEDHAQMQALVTELQEEWRLAATPRDEPQPTAPVLEKFSSADRHEVATIAVPAQSIRFRP
jgi:hypothetical protein